MEQTDDMEHNETTHVPVPSTLRQKRKAAELPLELAKRTSPIWNHYDFYLDGDKWYARCKYCLTHVYDMDSKLGTTNPKRHTAKCDAYADFLLANPDKKVVFCQKVYCRMFAEAILCHGYPLLIVEHEKLRKLHAYLNPCVKTISRNTIAKFCMIKHDKHIVQLRGILSMLPGKVCLTTDLWKACTGRGYLTLTAHYITHDWRLQSKVLNFRCFEPPHNAPRIADVIYSLIEGWGLEKKVFTMTVDNATSMTAMVPLVKARLECASPLICKGVYFHIRCVAHILNLIVQAGISHVDESVVRVRELVKYVVSSELRLFKFDQCLISSNLLKFGKLCLDVPTRWNSTYLMVHKALFARTALVSFQSSEFDYSDPVTDQDWIDVQIMCDFLEPFYEITNLFSGSDYLTSNLYLVNIVTIEKFMVDAHADPSYFISKIVVPMFQKYDKYWAEHSLVLSFAVLLDPRYKLHFVKDMYGVLYIYNECDRRVRKIFDSFVKFCEAHAPPPPISISDHNASHALNSSCGSGSSGPSKSFKRADLFKYFSSNSGLPKTVKSEIDSYFGEPLVADVGDFNILHYWKVNSVKFPFLSAVARDVLAISITIVASESSFSMGGRVLNRWRASLLHKRVEALVTTRNWLFGYEEAENNSELDVVIETDPLDYDEGSLPEH